MKHLSALAVLIFLINTAFAQIDLQCNGRDQHSIYLVTGDLNATNQNIERIDNVDTNPTDPVLVTVDTINTGGLSINKNLNGGSGYTMYSISLQTLKYVYWNGTKWVNTGHNGMETNPGGGNQYIFNLDGFLGTVYRYDGTGDAITLVQYLGTNNTAVYDVAVDKDENFYLLYPALSQVRAFTKDGVALDTFTTTGISPVQFGGPGIAILGNRMYYVDHTNSLYEGIITDKNIHFTVIKQLGIKYADIAACPNAAEVLTGFRNPEAPHFAVYPNPAIGTATIPMRNTATIEIFDCLGRRTLNAATSGLTQYRLDVNGWVPGVYRVKATSTSGTTAVQSLMVY